MNQELPKTFSKLQMPPINKQSQISMIEIVLLIVIIVLFYWFVISPKKVELTALETKVSDLKLEETKIQSQKQDLERFITAMRSDPESIAKLNESLPFDGKVMVLHLLIEKLASEAGVTLDNVAFSSVAESVTAGNRELLSNPYGSKRNLKKILGNMSVKGEQSQVQNFLKKMEESARFFDLSDLLINADPEGGTHLSAGLNTYYFAP